MSTENKLYHAAPIESRESIRKSGLDIKKDKTGMGAIFFSDAPPKPQNGFDVWEVDRSVVTVEPDFTGNPIDEEWFMSFEDVPDVRLYSHEA